MDGKGRLVNAELERGRDWRRKLLEGGAGAGGGQGSGVVSCPNYRAEKATYVSSLHTAFFALRQLITHPRFLFHCSRPKKHRVTGTFATVCRHNHIRSAIMVDTPGEGYEYTHLSVRKMLHESGQMPLTAVFGAAPSPLRPPVKVIISDLACKIKAHFQKHDPEILEHVIVVLGKVHEFAHNCRNKNSGRLHSRFADTSGEMCEARFSFPSATLLRIERMGPAVWSDSVSLLFRLKNDIAVLATPKLLVLKFNKAVIQLHVAASTLSSIVRQVGQDYSKKITGVEIIDDWKLATMGEVAAAAPLPPRVLAAGAHGEVAALEKKVASDEAALPYGNAAEAANLKALKAKLKSARKRLHDHHEDAGDSSPPTDSECRDFWIHEHEKAKVKVMEKEVAALTHSGDLKRGQGRTLHNHEKAKLRKKAARARKEAGDLRIIQQALPVVVPFPPVYPAAAAVPTLLKAQAVDALELARRSAEALALIPQESAAYGSHHRALADLLRKSFKPGGTAGGTWAPNFSQRLMFGASAAALRRARFHTAAAAKAESLTDQFPTTDYESAPLNIPWLGAALEQAVRDAASNWRAIMVVLHDINRPLPSYLYNARVHIGAKGFS